MSGKHNIIIIVSKTWLLRPGSNDDEIYIQAALKAISLKKVDIRNCIKVEIPLENVICRTVSLSKNYVIKFKIKANKPTKKLCINSHFLPGIPSKNETNLTFHKTAELTNKKNNSAKNSISPPLSKIIKSSSNFACFSDTAEI